MARVKAALVTKQTDHEAPRVAGFQIEYWPLDKIKPYPANARKITKSAIEKVAHSLQEFGWRQPIVVDKDGVIVAGHTRHAAAKSLGWATAPVHVAKDLTPEQIRAYRLADNRTNQETRWDMKLLAVEVGELAALGVDLATLGFEGIEVDRLTMQPGDDSDGAAGEPPKQPVTRPGDVWNLGPHRILCGDCTKPENVAKLLADDKPVLMVTDPPYGISLDAEWRDRVGANKLGGAEASYMKRFMTGHKVKGHTETAISGDTIADWSHAFELVPSLQVCYVWHASAYTVQVLQGLQRLGFTLYQQIIWRKPVASLTRTHYWYQHEPCWYARKPKAPWIGKAGEHTTVWDAASPKMIMGGDGEDKFDHPTQKPIETARRPMLNHLRRGGLVYEPFLGSGTTLMAADRTERVCLGMEIEPGYCDVVVQRWEAGTKRQATLEGGGTFAKTAKARGVKLAS